MVAVIFQKSVIMALAQCALFPFYISSSRFRAHQLVVNYTAPLPAIIIIIFVIIVIFSSSFSTR